LFVERKSGKTRLETPARDGAAAGRIFATLYQGESNTTNSTTPTKKASTSEAIAEGMLGSFRRDPNAPMNVEADALDVYDTQKQAVFRGNVKAQQGDFLVRTIEMIAFYSGQTGLGLESAAADNAAKGSAQLTRVEAKQRVLVTSIKDGQTATGDWAIFDAKANTVLMGDHVIVTRGKDVAEGPRLKINLTTGLYRFETESDTAPAAPAISASAPATAAPSASPEGRGCPPGKQCMLFYPKDAQQRAGDLVKKVAPDSAATVGASGWEASAGGSRPQGN
jgi:lipopolysaccharide transport protein LptA